MVLMTENMLISNITLNTTCRFFKFKVAVCHSGNLLLLAPIAFHRGLRVKKEYVLVASLALADCINGLLYMYAGMPYLCIFCVCSGPRGHAGVFVRTFIHVSRYI